MDGETVTMPHRPPGLGDENNGCPYTSTRMDKENQDSKGISKDERHCVILNVLKAILPPLRRSMIDDGRFNGISNFVHLLEGEVYMMTTDRASYMELLFRKIQYLRNQLNDCRLQRRGDASNSTLVKSEVDDDTEIEKLTQNMGSIELTAPKTKDVPLIIKDATQDEDKTALTDKGPDGLPMERSHGYSYHTETRFQQGSKKRMCDFEPEQYSMYMRPSREPEENDEFMMMPTNNLNKPHSKNDESFFDMDDIFNQPDSPEQLEILEELTRKVDGRTRHYSMMTGSPTSSSDTSVMSPGSSTTESDIFDPRDWSSQAYYNGQTSSFNQMVPSPSLSSQMGSPYNIPSPYSMQGTPSPCPSTGDLSDYELDMQDLMSIMQKEAERVDIKKQNSQRLDDGLNILKHDVEDIEAKKTPTKPPVKTVQKPVVVQASPVIVQANPVPILPVTAGFTVIPTPTTTVVTLPMGTMHGNSVIVVTQKQPPNNGFRKIQPRPTTNANDEDKKRMPPPKSPVSATKVTSSPKVNQNSAPASQSSTPSIPPATQTANRGSNVQLALAHRKVAMLSPEQLTAQDEDGDTALMICACRGDPITVEAICNRSLREPQAEIINQQNKMDQTSLYLAVSENHPAIVSNLVKYKANVNLAAKVKTQGVEDRMAPLHIASQHGDSHLAVLQELLKSSDINLDIQSRADGMTALHWAAKMHGKIDNSGKRIDSKRIVQELIKAGARVDIAEGKSGKTPMHLAVESMDGELVQCMIAAMISKVDPQNTQMSSGNTCMRISPSVVDTLNKPMFTGNTCLHIAAGLSVSSTNYMGATQQKNIITTLLRYGANRDVKNQLNEKPHSITRNPDILAILKGGQNVLRDTHSYNIPQVNMRYI